MNHSNSNDGQATGTHKRLLLGLIVCCLVLAVAAATLANMYYEQTRITLALISEPEVKPEVPVRSPKPAVAAAHVQPGTQTPISTEAPPANLADGAEVIVVSGYEADNQTEQGTVVQVDIDRPGKAVLLVLTSYDRIAWHVNATPNTRVQGIVISAHESPRLYSTVNAPAYQSKLPYAYARNSGNFAGLLSGLNTLFGIERLDAYRGRYALPNKVLINQPDTPQSALTLQGDQPQKPIKPYSFQLPTSSYGSVQWTLEGPANTIAASAELNFSKSVKATQDQRIYQIVGHDFKVTDLATGAQQDLDFPDNFPSLSWPMGVAYDSKRHYVSLFSLGGEGFIYRYDTRTGQWVDFRSLSNIDIQSISYDESTDRYVGWTTDGGIAVIDGDGTPRYTRHLADRLPGYKRLYDTGNSRPPNVMVVPRGEQMALVLPQDRKVGYVWYYDLGLDLGQLTYREGEGGDG